MQVVYDIWVNFVGVDEVGVGLRYYHEWRTEDDISMMGQICIYGVSEEFMDIVSEKRVVLPEDLLRDVFQKSYEVKGRGRKRHEYTFILSDGERAFVVYANGEGIIEKKSDLFPRQHRLVSSEFIGANLVELPEVIGECSVGLSIGMTRGEVELRRLVKGGLERELKGASRGKLLYYCTELIPGSYDECKDLTEEELEGMIYKEFSGEWSSRHDEFCKIFVGLNGSYKRDYIKLSKDRKKMGI